ncbi:unnamed protein product [Paramecium pentaurelia]|uniref:Transmembrane protein n=1 Tax=Paramecium pentaurelia TaxID=43138 RepID=A0A8S1YGK6_9CILI|nr:unnamed protein product [Paramecium pentaurelia]
MGVEEDISELGMQLSPGKPIYINQILDLTQYKKVSEYIKFTTSLRRGISQEQVDGLLNQIGIIENKIEINILIIESLLMKGRIIYIHKNGLFPFLAPEIYQPIKVNGIIHLMEWIIISLLLPWREMPFILLQSYLKLELILTWQIKRTRVGNFRKFLEAIQFILLNANYQKVSKKLIVLLQKQYVKCGQQLKLTNDYLEVLRFKTEEQMVISQVQQQSVVCLQQSIIIEQKLEPQQVIQQDLSFQQVNFSSIYSLSLQLFLLYRLKLIILSFFLYIFSKTLILIIQQRTLSRMNSFTKIFLLIQEINSNKIYDETFRFKQERKNFFSFCMPVIWQN